MEQVAGYCVRLEAAADGMRPDRRGAGVAPEDPFAPILTYLAQHENPLAREVVADDGVQGAGKLQPAAHADTAGEAGFLIEPGLGFPGRDEHSEPRRAPPKASQVRDDGATAPISSPPPAARRVPRKWSWMARRRHPWRETTAGRSRAPFYLVGAGAFSARITVRSFWARPFCSPQLAPLPWPEHLPITI